MPGKSAKTTLVTLRLPKEVVDKIEKRIAATGHPRTVSSYLKDRIIYDVSRKHGKKR